MTFLKVCTPVPLISHLTVCKRRKTSKNHLGIVVTVKASISKGCEFKPHRGQKTAERAPSSGVDGASGADQGTVDATSMWTPLNVFAFKTNLKYERKYLVSVKGLVA